MPQSLKQSVEDALRAYAPLNASRGAITVMVNDSQVTLSGYTPSSSSKRIAGILAASVVGVNEVINDLISAPDLERAVAMALATDERTRSWPIRVRAELGYVQLQGQVPDEKAAQAALEVARKVEGPEKVVSALKVDQLEALAA